MRPAALGLAAALAALAPALPAISAESTAPLAEADARFLAQAIRDGEVEVEMAKMAEQKASTAEVKQFAQRMVQDHGAMGQKLSRVAGEHDIENAGTYGPPQMQPADDEAAAARSAMAEKSGGEFDQAYVAAAVDGHEKAVGVFKDAAENAEDDDVRRLAADGLPVIQEHLAAAQALAEQISASR